MGWIGIVGPKDAGASERERMRAIAQTAFDEAGVESPTRIDVPAKGSGTSDEGASLRDEVMAIVPALQSGSLFGGATGVFVMDSQNLLKVELDAIVEMLANADPDQAVAVFAASGTLPAPLKKAIAASGEVVSFKALSARDAHQWIGEYARSNGLRIDAEARAELVKHFGANQAAMRQAIDQLAVSGGVIEASAIAATVDNRPDEPMWFLGDAIMAGDHAEALRRLSDFLQHNHPLILLSYLEGEVRKRSLAAVAPDYDTFAAWAKANPNSYATRKVWEGRTRANGRALSDCVRALAKADLTLKTQPEATHRVTLERLTVAMSRWMGR
ncbi:MAG: DNA polymerase III subunit delta [Acidimicrobiia bacterium]|nr:DNA polymerase III subunit delta [Acidimicrobiia bacterium]